MTTNHTPGPWVADYYPTYDGRNLTANIMIHPKVLGHVVRRSVAKVPREGGQEALANARLITAAPELLAQAEKHLAWLARLTDWAGADDPDLEGLRAAIAKAKGEQA